MLESCIVRAGNVIGVYEKNLASYLGGLVAEAKADILSNLISLIESHRDGEHVAWGEACPYLRDRLNHLNQSMVYEMTSALTDLCSQYERVLHHEITTSILPINISFFPLDKNDFVLLLSTTIDGKTFDEYIMEIISNNGNKILKACELEVVKHVTVPEFINETSKLVIKQMDEIQKLVELCFSSFSAYLIRDINSETINSFGEAVDAN